jgi:hypothetical protein
LHDVSAIRPAFPGNRRLKPRAVCRPNPSTFYIERIVDALTGVIVCGPGADRSIGPVTVEIRLAAHLTAADCAIFSRTQRGPERDTISRADLDLGRVANGTSIVFDLRITALDGEVEAETQGRFVAEALRVVGAFRLEQGVRVPPA